MSAETLDNLWNPEFANDLLRAVLVEIEAFADQLRPDAPKPYSMSSSKTSGTPS